MNITLKQLREAERAEVIELMNNPQVREHLPLANGLFTDEDYKTFLCEKEAIWHHNGYGPWAFFKGEKFIGWGGFQPEHGHADLALVLHPDYWGMGNALFRKITAMAFSEMKLESITILLPQSRTRLKGLYRLGFNPFGTVKIGQQTFNRYLLKSPPEKITG